MFKKSKAPSEEQNPASLGLGIPASNAPFTIQDVVHYLIHIKSPLLPWLSAYCVAHGIHKPISWDEAFTEADWNNPDRPLAIFSVRDLIASDGIVQLEQKFRKEHHRPLLIRESYLSHLVNSTENSFKWIVISPAYMLKHRADVEASLQSGSRTKYYCLFRDGFEYVKKRAFELCFEVLVFGQDSIQYFLILESARAGKVWAVKENNELIAFANPNLFKRQPKNWWHDLWAKCCYWRGA